MPEVSVVIPTYNSARYLTDAVDSVLAQSLKSFEVLVIDDGSTDQTAAVMRRYAAPVRYIRQENRGVSAARNRGIEESRGRYVAFLDADDVWYQNKLERQVAALGGDSDFRVCYSAFKVVDHELSTIGITRRERRGHVLEDLLSSGNSVGTPSSVISERSLIQGCGGFDTTLSQCADWDMWIRLAVVTDFLYLDEPLVAYRQHAGNMSRSATLLEHDSVQLLEKAFSLPVIPASLLDRRRSALARNYMVLAGSYFHAKRYRDFARCAVNAVSMDFRQIGHLIRFPVRMATRRWAHRFEGTM